jgi:hypothetical protein
MTILRVTAQYPTKKTDGEGDARISEWFAKEKGYVVKPPPSSPSQRGGDGNSVINIICVNICVNDY